MKFYEFRNAMKRGTVLHDDDAAMLVAIIIGTAVGLIYHVVWSIWP